MSTISPAWNSTSRFFFFGLPFASFDWLSCPNSSSSVGVIRPGVRGFDRLREPEITHQNTAELREGVDHTKLGKVSSPLSYGRWCYTRILPKVNNYTIFMAIDGPNKVGIVQHNGSQLRFVRRSAGDRQNSIST